MEQEKITRVKITEQELKDIVKKHLNSIGLDPLNGISIVPASRIEGYGNMESEVTFIRPLLIECKEL